MLTLAISLILIAFLACVLGTDGTLPAKVQIPERQLFPVMELDPAFNDIPGGNLGPRAPLAPGRLIEVPTWKNTNTAEGSDHVATLEPSAHPSLSGTLVPSSSRRNGLRTRPPSIHVLEGNPGVTISTLPGSSASRSQFRLPYHLPAFELRGQRWGPYQVGTDRFALQAYPLDLPAFRHLYQGYALRSWKPWNFEHFIANDAFSAAGIRFQPDPSVLLAIRGLIWRSLQTEGIAPRLVSQGETLIQGDYLWPPVEITRFGSDDLDIVRSLLTQRIRQAIAEQISVHSIGRPRLFHLEVIIGHQVRHILMVPARVPRFFDPSRSFADSQPWFFFEGMRATGNRLAFLGATFLPKDVEWVLLKSQTIQVALPSLASVPRSLRPV